MNSLNVQLLLYKTFATFFIKVCIILSTKAKTITNNKVYTQVKQS